MATFYTATIHHHNISQAPVIGPFDTMAKAKSAGFKRFGGGFLDHKIIVIEHRDARPPEDVAWRRIGGRAWWTR